MAGHISSSSSVQWQTPKRILDPVRDFFSGGIDLDPCASAIGGIGARMDFMLPANGLEKPWHGNTFVNPPFGTSYIFGMNCQTSSEFNRLKASGSLGAADGWRRQTLSQWVEKAWLHYLAGEAETILLLPASVDTKWWQNLILPAAAGVCFIEGRMRFEGAAQGAPMAGALGYFGDSGHRFKRVFATLGFCT